MMASTHHPSSLDLDQFVDSFSSDAEQARVAGHLADCEPCRRRAAQSTAMRDSVRAEPVPPLSADTLERILARRAKGERGPRAVHPATRRDRSRSAALIGGALAAGLVVAVVLARPDWSRNADMRVPSDCLPASTPTGEDPMKMPLLRRYLTATSPAPLALLLGCADQGPNAPLVPAPALAVADIRGDRLVPATLTYQATSIIDGLERLRQESRHMRISSSQLDGTPTWTINSWHQRPRLGTFNGDTLQVQRSTLVPLALYRRQVPVRSGWSYEVNRETRSLYMMIKNSKGEVTDRSYTLAHPDSLPKPLLLPIVFRALRLHRDWSASFEVFHPSSFFVGPFLRRRDGKWYGRTIAHVRVVGEDRVTVPAGTFDTWRVRIQREFTGEHQVVIPPEDVWVGKRDGWIVKTFSRRSIGDDYTEDLETVLVALRQ